MSFLDFQWRGCWISLNFPSEKLPVSLSGDKQFQSKPRLTCKVKVDYNSTSYQRTKGSTEIVAAMLIFDLFESYLSVGQIEI